MRNHFVPQFLQMPWTSSDGMLQQFRLADGLTKRRPPKATGFEHDLLSLTRSEVMGMDRHAIEKVVLQRVDNDAELVRLKMMAGQSLSHQERCTWVRFLMSLRLRQPQIINLLKSGSAEMLRHKLAENSQEYESIAPSDGFPTLEQWTEAHFPGAIENFGLSFFHKLIDDEIIGAKLLNLNWWIWRFGPNDNSLLLADHPCVFAGGIDDPHLAVMLPISPRAAFIATRGERLCNELSRAESRGLSKNFNDASIRQAARYVYAVDASQRRFIENRRPPRSGKTGRNRPAIRN